MRTLISGFRQAISRSEFARRLRRGLHPFDENDLRSIKPISADWGYERGTPIDRYYIDQFLSRHQSCIAGAVLEIGADDYTSSYGGTRVTSSDILHIGPRCPTATIIGDLTKLDTLPTAQFDCFICTQTLQFIFDLPAAIRGIQQVMKPAGVVLATVPGISQTSRYDMQHWGDFWRFTTASADAMFRNAFEEVDVVSFGNVLAATSFLRGLAIEDLPDRSRLDLCDPDYQLTIGIIAAKPKSLASPVTT